MRRFRAADLLWFLGLLAAVWVAVITYGFVKGFRTDAAVKDIVREVQRPSAEQDRRSAQRRIGRLSDEQLLELDKRIRGARRRAREARRRVPDDVPSGRRGSSGGPRAAVAPVVRPTPTPTVEPSPAVTFVPGARTPRPDRPVVAPTVVVSVTATATPTAVRRVVGVDVPLLPLEVCTGLVAVNCSR